MKNFNIKKYYRTIILLIILILLIIFRNNLISILSKTFYSQEVGNSSVKNSDDKDIIDFSRKEDMMLKGKSVTPGALKLINKFINSDEVVLSKDAIINITNSYRQDKDLKPLKENAKLDSSAEKKLKDIFDNQYFEHVSPSGIEIEDLVEGAGYKYIIIGENLAMGNFKNDQALVDAWMNSAGHRKNILNENYTEIGVAVGKGILNDNSVFVAVQHFGTPRDICPLVDEKLSTVVGYNQEQINILKKELDTRLLEIDREYVPYKGLKDPKKAEEYNNLVIYYNKLIDDTENNVKVYNEQVRNFNLCMLKYQE